MTTLATPAWLLAGRLRNVPGVLACGEGRLAFVTEDGPVFSAPLAEVGPVRRPWWWFGGGVVVPVHGETFKITFVRPNGAPDADPSLLDAGIALAAVLGGADAPVHSVRGLFDVHSGRKAAAAWKEILPG